MVHSAHVFYPAPHPCLSGLLKARAVYYSVRTAPSAMGPRAWVVLVITAIIYNNPGLRLLSHLGHVYTAQQRVSEPRATDLGASCGAKNSRVDVRGWSLGSETQ